MNMSDLKKFFTDHHAAEPQKAGAAAVHLASIESGLAALAALGHRLMLVWDHTPPVQEYPRMLYKHAAPERVVASVEEELAAMKEGWGLHPTLEAAAKESEAEAAKATAEVESAVDHSAELTRLRNELATVRGDLAAAKARLGIEERSKETLGGLEGEHAVSNAPPPFSAISSPSSTSVDTP